MVGLGGRSPMISESERLIFESGGWRKKKPEMKKSKNGRG